MPEPTLETVLEAITTLRSEFGTLRSEFVTMRTDLSGRIDRLEQGQTRLEQGQTQLRVELSERIDRVQNALTALRQSNIIDWANFDRAERIAKAASDETRALAVQVTELTKLVHILEAQIRELRGDG